MMGPLSQPGSDSPQPHRLSEATAVSKDQDVPPDNARDTVDHPLAVPPSDTEIPSL